MEHGSLYLCATPIGNLDDVTFRTINVLKSVDIIACEDTRHSLKLLNHFEISKPLTSYFEHNKKEKGELLIKEMKSGKNVALITDAGTPAISDPGEDLVKMCIEQGIRVVPVPGAVALINALIISGKDTGRFCFEGFLSVNKKSRSDHLEELKDEKRTMIFYEAPHKLKRTLDDFLKTFGDREISLVREITKIHEECVATTVAKAVEFYSQNAPKGEYVLVLAGKSDDEVKKEQEQKYENISVTSHIDMLIAQGMDKKDAIREAARQRGMSRRDAYNEYVKSN